MPESRHDLRAQPVEIKDSARMLREKPENRRQTGALQLAIDREEANRETIRKHSSLQVAAPALQKPGAVSVQHSFDGKLRQQARAGAALVFAWEIEQVQS